MIRFKGAMHGLLLVCAVTVFAVDGHAITGDKAEFKKVADDVYACYNAGASVVELRYCESVMMIP